MPTDNAAELQRRARIETRKYASRKIFFKAPFPFVHPHNYRYLGLSAQKLMARSQKA